MTQQIQESIELGGHTFDVEEFARFPKNHPLLVDEDVRAKQGIPIPRRPMNSACHRNYVGSWRIDEHGALWLCQISGRYRLLEPELRADWFTGTIAIPIGECDRTECLQSPYQIRREAMLELRLKKGTVTHWRYGLQKAITKPKWVAGYDESSIITTLESVGDGEDFQPSPITAKHRLSPEDEEKMVLESSRLLRRALADKTKLGATVLQPDDWKLLRRGFGDPSPELPVQQALGVLRGIISTHPSQAS